MGRAQRQVLESTERQGEVIVCYGATALNGTVVMAILVSDFSGQPPLKESISIDRNF